MSVFDKIKERMYKCRRSRSLDENDIDTPTFTSRFLNHQSHLVPAPASLMKDDLKKKQADLRPLAQRRVDYSNTGELSPTALKKAEEAKKKKSDLTSAAKKKADEAQKKKDELAAAAKKKLSDAKKKQADLRSSAQKKADDAKNKLGRGSTKKKADNVNYKKGTQTPMQDADDSCSQPSHSYTIPYIANPAPDIGRFQESKESLDSVTSPETNMRSGPFRQYNGGLPPYSYIGREAKKLLNKYWNYAPWHIDCITKCIDWLDLFSYADGEHNLGKVTGGVGLRQSFNYFEFSQNWQTDAWVGTAGLNVDTGLALLSSLFQIAYITKDNGGLQANIDIGLEQYPVKVEVIVPLKMPTPKITGYVVVYPATNFLLGYRSSYDLDVSRFEKHSFGACYRSDETELALKLKNFQNISGSIFQRLGEFWAVAFKGKLYGENREQFSIGAQYHIYDELLLKARICDTGLLGLAFRHRVTDGIRALYHCSFNVNSPSFKSCRFGVGWSIFG